MLSRQEQAHYLGTGLSQNVSSAFDMELPSAVFILDIEGHITSWSPSAQRLMSYRPADIVGSHLRLIYTEDERARGMPEQALKAARDNGQYEHMAWAVRKDGGRFTARFSLDSIYGRDGNILGFTVTTMDMTEQLNIEEKFREATLLRSMIDTAMDGVLMIDAHTTILMANPACQKLFGYRIDELIGRNLSEIIECPSPYDGDGDLAARPRTMTRHLAGIGREVMGRRKDATTFPAALSLGETRQEGENIYVGIVHDISERKRTDEQLLQARKMEAVGQLSGGIAHDFNNLLTVIIGNADLLQDSLETHPDLKQLCETIQTAGQRGAALTQRLLAFSRRQTLLPTVIDCAKLAEDLQRTLRESLTDDIVIRVTTETSLFQAFADPSQLEKAVLNLAQNARDAMPLGGHLSINISNATLDKSYQDENPEVRPGDYVMIAVTDDGEGMPSEICEHAFEPFFTTREPGKGSGLGLSMIYGFIKQSNGHVAIYSEPGLGTTVRLYIPATLSVDTPAREGPKSVSLPALRGTETVLVVEDDPFVRGHAVSSLESFGYRVITATDSREALAKLHEDSSIALLFSDVVMSGPLSGPELMEQARKHRPDLKILLTSGYPSETLIHRYGHNPGLALLGKPYRKLELGRRLREVFDLSSKQAPPPQTYNRQMI